MFWRCVTYCFYLTYNTIYNKVHPVRLLQLFFIPEYGQKFLTFNGVPVFLQQVFQGCLVR